ncbi:MAG TPA: alkaline phosphatase family protein, partial [Emcibacteraceae bacterium]|nr:alkaline phosphatase family protein [Emcibacteraceae bacterium]
MSRISTRLFFIIFCFIFSGTIAQAAGKTENVILISLDGMRWQEVFKGFDKRFLDQEKYAKYHYTYADFKNKFWDNNPEAAREKLFPFLWTTVATQGQLYGNRDKGSNANITNSYHFSYPGYNEILTGFADPRINSNDKILNPNKTFLEWLDEKPEYKGKTAAFASWDVFPYIINQQRSHVFLNAGFDDMMELNARVKDLNKLQKDTPSPWDSVGLDVFTFNFATEYMKAKHPKALYISFGETDDFAHDGYYDQYMLAAHRADDFIRRIWEFVQNDPAYKDKTTLLVTTDHGRGDDSLESWKSHGAEKDASGNISYYSGDDQIWMAVIGPDTPADGEMKKTD